MSATRHGITTSAITWEQEESEIEEDSAGKNTITVVGSVGVAGTSVSLADAIDLIPMEIPLSTSGPIGNAVKFLGAKRSNRGAKFHGDDTIQVRATYEISLPINQVNGPDGSADTSDSDRAQRSIVSEDAPLLSHPIVQEFPETDRRKLASLLQGEIRVNPRFDSAGSGTQLYEFITDNEAGDGIEGVTFDAVDVTFDDIEASPLDYARLLAAGVNTYRRPVIRHTLVKSRNDPAPNAEYGKVGEVIASTPALAPTLTGDGQWFLNGITDSTDNGEAWTTSYEFERTAAGGALKAIYKGGSAEIA